MSSPMRCAALSARPGPAWRRAATVMRPAPSSPSAASAEQAVAPEPRTTARSIGGCFCEESPGVLCAVSRSAPTMPATSVLNPARSGAAALRDHGVHRPDGLGQGINNVQVRQERLLMGHGDAQSRPDRSGLHRSGHLGEQHGQVRRRRLAALIGPVAQTQPGVGGPMQRRRQRVAHWTAGNGGTVADHRVRPISHSSSSRRCRSPRSSCSTHRASWCWPSAPHLWRRTGSHRSRD